MSNQADLKFFIGRQPILNVKQEIYGYELLFRAAGHHTTAMFESRAQASASVIACALSDFGLQDVLGHAMPVHPGAVLAVAVEEQVLPLLKADHRVPSRDEHPFVDQIVLAAAADGELIAGYGERAALVRAIDAHKAGAFTR